jgi:prephenate dehydratase
MTMTKQATIAFQGAPGAFSHQAALAFAKQLGVEAQIVPCQTFGDMFQNVSNGTTEFGTVPLENSSIGSITANYDLLWNSSAKIIAEYVLPVHHHLIGWPGVEIGSLTTVYSHPAALDQCRELFQKYPNLTARVHWDTSGAVVHVKETGDKTAAAIAGELAAKEYGMAIIASNVEDYAHNSTRFGLITAASALQPASEPPFKLSCAIELEHKPGALAGVLNSLAATGANLTKIESRPIGETLWHYRFFMDLELPADNIDAIEAALKIYCRNFKVLGRYKAALVPKK